MAKTTNKWYSRKFLLMTALFISSQILMWFEKIPSLYWLLGSTIGTFGFIVVRAWLDKMYLDKEK